MPTPFTRAATPESAGAAGLLADGPEIEPDDLPPGSLHRLGGAAPGMPARLSVAAGTELDSRVAQAERTAVEQALARARGRKAEAARLLGIHRTTLYDKLRKYGLV